MSPASQSPLSKPPEQLELAKSPFDDAKADLILRSSDEVPVHFRVFKIILSLASPIFADMFSIPSPSPPSEKLHDEVQVVPLSEHSTALDIALRHIYPVKRPPKTDTLHCASILAEFSRKYEVEALYRFIIGYLRDGIEHDPVGVYAIAVTYGYGDIGADAARSCLNLPYSDLQSSYLQYATAEHILELLKYHVACGQAASALASSDRSWFSSLAQAGILTPQSGYQCRSCLMPDFVDQTSSRESGFHGSISEGDNRELSERKSGPLCVWNYFHRSALVLAHHPTPEAITTEAFVLEANDCACARFLRVYMIELSAIFGREIKNTILQVSLLSYYCCPCSYIMMAGSLTQGCLPGIGAIS